MNRNHDSRDGYFGLIVLAKCHRIVPIFIIFLVLGNVEAQQLKNGIIQKYLRKV